MMLLQKAPVLLAVSFLFRASSFHTTSLPSKRRSLLPRSSTVQSAATYTVPSLPPSAISDLATTGYTILPGYLSADLVSSLVEDVENLRSLGDFNVARIGQDFTNTLNTEVRIAETCFIGRGKKLGGNDSSARSALYDTLDAVRRGLSGNADLDALNEDGELITCAPVLDAGLDELLYAYYPKGGYYRRHRDAIAGSASVLRCYSLLLYLNEEWNKEDEGQLRMHFDGGGDEVPDGVEENYLDVDPKGGTLVLFQSDKVPHEVLDTRSKRIAVVGWYNRAATTADISSLSSQEDVTRLGMLAVAAVMVLGGVASLVL
mmetsp:Transcript_37728/g.87864  ORF Transcript_37728/g.87864 Transcript_37728/m.87864 type:complete len:317 (-) Transcript_37728:310-1260(-)|eukprot:CAMPEP_0113320714 /NCGR_PEP_ID=MMETSP0010_2-20120614/14439_1 /TAXON_ID=216773 ORGANISM="Corethron hystrix, Strain 308" /NCGR_SAMPLE_ID=MMETSP0010_2 /ASSEMBLY_ACC=CAM_ASM_000155 /LENGTH=316 /DNA_ID=CAMNT_0000178605 /DNA_START=234 /DNA_END=1184 /DNA_ORIENTATION=- /assembly_acc=CAM_ASM_000155